VSGLSVLRYKVIDAARQSKAQGYAEDKMEVGSTGGRLLDIVTPAGGTTLDALVIKLVQRTSRT